LVPGFYRRGSQLLDIDEAAKYLGLTRPVSKNSEKHSRNRQKQDSHATKILVDSVSYGLHKIA
jgi:hypothetical protein